MRQRAYRLLHQRTLAQSQKTSRVGSACRSTAHGAEGWPFSIDEGSARPAGIAARSWTAIRFAPRETDEASPD